MRAVLRASLRASLGGALCVLLAPPAAGFETPERIQRCVRENLPAHSSRQAVRLRRVDRTGSAEESRAQILWRRFEAGSRAVVRFSAPSELEGSALLVVAREPRPDMYLLLPELGALRRVTGRSVAESLFGTDFSLEDFARLYGLFEAPKLSRLPDSEVEGRAVYVLEMRPPAGQESQYERILSYVDRETCVALRTELFDRPERMRKLMKIPYRRVERRGSGHLPTLVLMKDLIDETYTEILVDELSLDLELPEALFSEQGLGQPGPGTPGAAGG